MLNISVEIFNDAIKSGYGASSALFLGAYSARGRTCPCCCLWYDCKCWPIGLYCTVPVYDLYSMQIVMLLHDLLM